MSEVAFVCCSVNLFSQPVCAVLWRILVKTFPPYCQVVIVKSNICENGVLLCRFQSVEVCLFACSRSNSEETCFRINSIELSVFRIDSQPSDIVADCPNLISFFLEIFRRNKHSEICFTASAWECGSNILNFSLRIFKTKDKHVFCHPAFLLSEI